MPASRAVVTAIGESFLRGASAMYRSLMAFHPECRRLCYIHERSVEEAAAYLGHLAEVRPFPRAVAGVPDDQLPLAGRFFAFECEEDVVVFLDSDMVVTGSLEEYFNCPKGALCAVQDVANSILDQVPEATKPAFVDRYGSKSNIRGLNVGAFSFRPSDWTGILEDFEKEIEYFGELAKIPMFDQVFASIRFHEVIRWLPFRYNVHVLSDNLPVKEPHIIHFTGGPKPWQVGFPKHALSYPYWVEHSGEHTRLQVILAKLWVRLNTPRRLGFRIAEGLRRFFR